MPRYGADFGRRSMSRGGMRPGSEFGGEMGGMGRGMSTGPFRGRGQMHDSYFRRDFLTNQGDFTPEFGGGDEYGYRGSRMGGDDFIEDRFGGMDRGYGEDFRGGMMNRDFGGGMNREFGGMNRDFGGGMNRQHGGGMSRDFGGGMNRGRGMNRERGGYDQGYHGMHRDFGGGMNREFGGGMNRDFGGGMNRGENRGFGDRWGGSRRNEMPWRGYDRW